MSNIERNHTNAADDQPESTLEEKQWQNFDEFVDDENFARYMWEKFPREAAILEGSGMSRRQFMSLMGASLVMGGLAISGCAPSLRGEHEEIIPYVQLPEQIVPGKPLYFATSAVIGGHATGVLVETHEGRPTRVEGNPAHPASLGGTNAMIQATILELYNPLRSTAVVNEDRVSSLDAFFSAMGILRANLDGTDGSGLRILTETVTSPSMTAAIESLLEDYPEARWYQYEPIARDSEYEGSVLAFGEPVNTVYRFDEADVVLALDSDFMMSMQGSIRYARDFMSRRKVTSDALEMNRLYAVESTPTNTGIKADHRLKLRSSEVEQFVLALANALGVSGGQEVAFPTWNTEWFDAVVADLEANRGSSIVVAGEHQTPLVNALVHAINAELGNVGSTVIYTPPTVSRPANATEQLGQLVSDMSSGNVESLFILGGNPAYTAPADIPFAGALSRVPFSMHLSTYFDETSANCTWHVPMTHYLEAWGDARAFDGTVSVIQPPIGPLFETALSEYDVLARLSNDSRTGYEVVRDYWQNQYEGDDFEAFWRRALHDGIVEGSTPEPIQPAISGDLAAQVNELSSLRLETDELEIVFRPDPALWDGRFGNNSWMQELPHPLTSVTWDNTAMISPTTAELLELETGDLIELTYRNRTMTLPVYVLAGHVDGSVTVPLGYGSGLIPRELLWPTDQDLPDGLPLGSVARIGSELGDDLNFSAYQLRTANAPWFDSGLQISDTGRNYRLALTQEHFDPELTEPIRSATLAYFIENPGFAAEETAEQASLYPDFEYDGYAWGMTIDLTSCIGCNACMTACQSENNIPTVGKDEVLQERDLFWIRVDRYTEEEDGVESTGFQPVPCMHCEKAPCEQVCPVQATVHDHEGLNQMTYNRCIGTRYCSANCPYSVRRFNFLDYVDESNEILYELRNPDVSVRARGVMEKCTYCVQRINEARIESSKDNRPIFDGEIVPACASACPTNAIIFGDVNDPDTNVSQWKAQPHNYGLLAELNTVPRTTYLAQLTNPTDTLNIVDVETDEEGE